MIARILSVLFPPRLPGRVRDWHDRAEYFAEEQGWAGNVRRKYTGIERHWLEVDSKYRRIDRRQWNLQMKHAEKHMAALEQDLRDQGYVNTIHDCWELPEKKS